MDIAEKREFEILDKHLSTLNEAIAPAKVIGEYRDVKLKKNFLD